MESIRRISSMTDQELDKLKGNNTAESHNKIKLFLSKLEGAMNVELDNFDLKVKRRQSVHANLIRQESANKKEATLHYEDKKTGESKTFQIPILVGSDGKEMLDIQALYAKAKIFCYDPGFTVTGSCKSTIGNATADGKLYYRGYDVEDLVEQASFTEICFVLIYGSKPTEEELNEYESRIKDEMLIKDKMMEFYKGFQSNANPMDILMSVIAGLSSFLHNTLDIKDSMQRELSALKLIAKMPVLAAIAFRTSAGLPIVLPQRNLSYMENFLNMLFQDPMDKKFNCPAVMVKMIEKLFILHAECDQGPSTTSVRVAGSSLANPFAAISAGVGSLKGQQHGGATEKCLAQYESIGSVENIPSFLEKVKDKKDSTLLYGFGHRIFKAYDPRAKCIKSMIFEFKKEMNIGNNQILDIALALEEAALNDEYFQKRNLYPNIDYFSGILMRMMNIPQSMFNVMFAIPRSSGWIAHWREMMSDAVIKIYRPRQIYVGEKLREFVPIEERKDAAGFSLKSYKNI